MYIKKIMTYVIAVTLLGSMLLVAPVYALTTGEVREDLQENREERRETIVENRCEVVTSRINSLTERYEKGQTKYLNRYEQLIEKLNNLSDTLSSNDIDTATLDSDIEVLVVMVDEFNSQVENTINLFSETKDNACGTGDGEYRTELGKARESAAQIRSKAREINQFFLNNIIDDLEEIKNYIVEEA